MPLASTSALPFGVSPVLAGVICAKAVETMRTVLTSRTPALLIIGSFLSARGFTSGRTPEPANYSEKIRDLVPSRGNKTETTRVLARAMSQAGEIHGQQSNSHSYATKAAAALLAVTALLCNPANAAGNISRGEGLYRGCQDCHSIEKNDVGPRSDAQGHRWPCCRHRARLQLLTSIAECKDHMDRAKPGQMAEQSAGAYSRDKNVLRSQECSGPCRYHRIPQRTRALTAKKIDKFSPSNRSRVVGRL